MNAPNTRSRPAPPVPIRRRESLKNVNKVSLASGVNLEGDELEDYCKRRGLCPLCAKTRTRKRVFKLLKKNKWELLTLYDKSGQCTVYKGYCVKPNCFSLAQAKRLSGDPVGPSKSSLRTSSSRRASRTRSVMRGSNGNVDVTSTFNDSMSYFNSAESSLNLAASQKGKGAQKREVVAFPPIELRNTANFEVQADKPLFVIEKTVQGLQEDSNTISLLDLSGLQLRTIDYEALSKALRVNTTLTGLIMENSKLNDEHLELLASGLDDAKDIPLVKLYLRSNQITDAGLDKLCPFLQANVTLEKLDISRNNVSSKGALALFSAFHRNRLTRIRCINLSHNSLWDITDAQSGIEPFLRRNRTLRILNLEGNHIHDESIQAMAVGLQENEQTALERLYLGWNAVGDDGTIALAEMLEANTSLRVLGLGENQIQNTGARALLAAMDVNITIREISGLWRNRIDRRFIIIAIRRLLLSVENSDSVRVQLYEQAPSNNVGRMTSTLEIESEFEESVNDSTKSAGGATAMSSISQDPDYADPLHFEEEIRNDPKEKLDSSIVRKAAFPPLPEAAVNHRSYGQNRASLGTVVEGARPAHDQIMVFHSSPLVFFDRDIELHRAIPLTDTNYEVETIRKSLDQVVGGQVDVKPTVATVDSFTKFFADPSGHIMHFSSNCQHGVLGLENGYGSMQTMPADTLRRLVESVDSNLRVVVISSKYAESIGRIFLDAGVPHVVCCELDNKYRDHASMEFVRHFYKSLATNKTLRESFSIALSAVLNAPSSSFMRRLRDRFLLLPEIADDDTHHDIKPFFSQTFQPRSITEGEGDVNGKLLPAIPEHFLGREIDMYEILEALRVDDVVRIAGPPGSGKDSVVTAACQYALDRRKTFSVDNIFWLPAPEGIVPDEDSLYGDLCLCTNILKDSRVDVWDKDEALIECKDRIEVELEELQVVLVIDERQISSRGAQEGVEKFVSFLLNIANAKIILLTSKSADGMSLISHVSSIGAGAHIEEASIEIEPLDFRSTALLFGGISKFITSSGCPAAHSAEEFADLLEPAFITRLPDKSAIISQRRSALFARMGGGRPTDVVNEAMNMTKEGFIELIGIANKPEIFVDSLGALDTEIRKRSGQRRKEVDDKNFLRVLSLDQILEELEAMRPEFPTLEELKEEEKLLRADMTEAVSRRRYDTANDLKRDLLALKKKILKEQRLQPGASADEEANETLNEFQAHVDTVMREARRTSSIKKLVGVDQAMTYTVNCNTRDCDFVIYAGNIEDFDHAAEAKGLVCWSNESCELSDTVVGDRLLRRGGPALEQDLDLPVVLQSKYGPVRCGTGNAVFVGPSKYGSLAPPCLILAVGPLTPRSLKDVRTDVDSDDTLHYITNMLRSSYRSSMVLAKHAGLEAMAISLLTTRRTGQAYEQTLRIGLQTLVEEVQFSQLRDVHIVASSLEEVSVIGEILASMGHREV